MLSARGIRILALCALLAASAALLHYSSADPAKITVWVTAVIGAVTAIYALFTYEILLQNQAMAKATADSTRVMEQSLRFSFAPNLLFRTLNTKDPKLAKRNNFKAFDNEDYQKALSDSSTEQQKEFVFAVVQNVGRGAATNVTVRAQYNIRDSGSPNSSFSVHKIASIQILESGEALAVYVYVSKLPTVDDRVELTSASVTASDFYRDALHEPPLETHLDTGAHKVEMEAGCVLRIV